MTTNTSTTNTNTNNTIHRPYKAQIHIALPSHTHAQHLHNVVSVDGELGNKIIKSFEVVRVEDVPTNVPPTDDNDDDRLLQVGGDGGDGDGDLRVLRINFEATEAKMLRVAISTTYDMINVALKCFQEFGEL